MDRTINRSTVFYLQVKRTQLKLLLLLLLIAKAFIVDAQSDFDTTYYESCKKNLSIGLLFAQRSYELRVTQKITADTNALSPINYIAEARNTSGFIIDYDKFSLQVGFRTGKTDVAKKGITDYKNIQLNVGGNKILFEGSYRQYEGFYDSRSSYYLSNFNDSTPYYHNNNLNALRIKVRALYFTNYEKFAYKSVYSCGYRQKKSAYTWVLAGSSYYESFSSSSGIIPDSIRNFYGGQQTLNEISNLGIAGGIGLSGTLVVFKRFFVNATAIPSIAMQFRNYKYIDIQNSKATYIALNADLRLSIGYNAEKFFLFICSGTDIHVYEGKGLSITPRFTTTMFTFGYRFGVNPEFTKKMQEHSIYKKL